MLITKKYLINFLLILFLLPSFVSAEEKNCYGYNALATEKFNYYKLANGYCEYPIKENRKKKGDGIYPFLGFSTYQWKITTSNQKDNVSIENNLSLHGCGDTTFPCYCDSSISKDNPNYQNYCCPSNTNTFCLRKKNAIYINRPFYSIYKKNGDLEIKNNIAISGDSNYFLNDFSKIGIYSTLLKTYQSFMSFKKNISDVFVNAHIKIGRFLIFNNKFGDISLGETTQISKVKKNKIILSNLMGKEQRSVWSELNANKLDLEKFGEITAITNNDNYFYLTDKEEKKIHRINGSTGITPKENSNQMNLEWDTKEILSTGNHDWAWEPSGLDVDENEYLYISSSFTEFEENSIQQLRINSPAPNTIYKQGETVIISWSKLPKATNYKLHYRKNDVAMDIITLNSQENSFEFKLDEKTIQNMLGSWTFTISVELDGKPVFANNTCTFSVVSLSEDTFRITNPKYNNEFEIGDIIPFSWDKYPEAKEYSLVYKINNEEEKEISVGEKDIFEIEAREDTLAPGNYEFKVKAYDKNKKLLKTSINNILFTIVEEKKEITSLSHNIFKISLEKNDKGNIKEFETFIPKQKNFEDTLNYEIIRDYLIYKNNDPLALFLKNPKSIKYYNNYIYIVDNGNNRIVRLNKDINLSKGVGKEVGNKLKKIKYNYLEKFKEGLIVSKNWQDEVSSSSDKDFINNYLDDYWKIIYDNSTDNLIGSLSNPQDIFIENENIYISDTNNKRIVFQDSDKTWKTIIANWSPYGIYKLNKYLYITDVLNGNITRIDMDLYSLNNTLIFNNNYFQLGRRGQEKYEFSFPIDIALKNNLFYIIDSVSNTGYSLIAGNTDSTSATDAKTASSSLINLYSGEATRNIDTFLKNPYNNELNSDTLADAIKIDDSVSFFNNVYNRIEKWKKGPGVAHCEKKCSDGYTEWKVYDSCGNETTYSHTCNGCWKDTIILDCEGNNKCNSGCTDIDYDAKYVRTCRDQWDWDANSPSCDYYVVEPNCHIESIELGEGETCECPCVSSWTVCEPYCKVVKNNCHVGYAVGFEDYTNPTVENPTVESTENYELSIKEGWPDYIY